MAGYSVARRMVYGKLSIFQACEAQGGTPIDI